MAWKRTSVDTRPEVLSFIQKKTNKELTVCALFWPKDRTVIQNPVGTAVSKEKNFKADYSCTPLPSLSSLLLWLLTFTEWLLIADRGDGGPLSRARVMWFQGTKQLRSQGDYYRKSARSAAKPQTKWEAVEHWTLCIFEAPGLSLIVPSLQTSVCAHRPLIMAHMASPGMEDFTANLGDFHLWRPLPSPGLLCLCWNPSKKE